MRVTRFLWCLLVAVALILTGCEGGEDDDVEDAGLANPASVYCEEQGGTVEIISDADGNQTGICRLADGTEMDEWDYYRQSQDGAAGLANPAAVFCEEQGGVVSGPEPMCRLPDGEVFDAWEYFRAES